MTLNEHLRRLAADLRGGHGPEVDEAGFVVIRNPAGRIVAHLPQKDSPPDPGRPPENTA